MLFSYVTNSTLEQSSGQSTSVSSGIHTALPHFLVGGEVTGELDFGNKVGFFVGSALDGLFDGGFVGIGALLKFSSTSANHGVVLLLMLLILTIKVLPDPLQLMKL